MGVSAWPLFVHFIIFSKLAQIYVLYCYFLVSWASHIRRRQNPARFDWLGKDRARAALRRSYG